MIVRALLSLIGRVSTGLLHHLIQITPILWRPVYLQALIWLISLQKIYKLIFKYFDWTILHFNMLSQVMVPIKFSEFIDDLTNLVKNKYIPMDRIDDAVGRILQVKFISGLFENPLADLSLVNELGKQASKSPRHVTLVILNFISVTRCLFTACPLIFSHGVIICNQSIPLVF